MKQRFSDIVKLKDLVVNIGKWVWKSSRPLPDWDMLCSAKVWKSPGKNISEFVHQLRVPLREFREIAKDAEEVALIQVGPAGTPDTEFFCVYNEKEKDGIVEGADIPAVALEHPAVAMVLGADGLKPDNLPAHVTKLCGEGVPCLLWGTRTAAKELRDVLEKEGGYIGIQDILTVNRHTSDPWWTSGCMCLLSVNKKKKV